MRWIVAILLAVHGLIHFMGFAKAFGYAELPQLTLPASRAMGVVWLTGGVLVVVSAVTMAGRPMTPIDKQDVVRMNRDTLSLDMFARWPCQFRIVEWSPSRAAASLPRRPGSGRCACEGSTVRSN
jgi:hypothetical protein